MILVPYTVTALAESDAEGTSGKNIIENAPITLTDLDDNPVTMYDDASGSSPDLIKYTNTEGYKIIWIESGTYKLTVNSTLAYVEIALDTRPYGIAVESGIAWPNGQDLTDFTGVFPFVNYTLDFSAPYTGVGLPSSLENQDLNATLIYEGDLNGFGIFRLIDVATGNVWIKTWNNQTTQVDWQQIGTETQIQQTTDINVHDSMYSWWTAPKTIRYTDDSRDWTVQSFNQSNGAVGVFIHDHITRNTRKYILDTDRTPDDHNAGCICIGDGKVVAVYGGRSNTAAPVDECLVCEWDINQEPNPANVTKYYLGVGRDYPVMFQYESDVILIASQRGAPDPLNPPNNYETGHAFMTNSWPLGSGAGSWSAKTPLTNYVFGDPNIMPAWQYMTARRNADNPSIIDMIWGFHPFPNNQPLANIYKSQIRHVGGVNPWRFYVNGVEVANLSTGVGLPIELADLELAYTAGVGEKTRLYDVKGDSFIFTSYTTDASLSTYQYGYKSGGVWLDSFVAHCGDPFLKQQSFYFGGASISENDDVVTIAQNNSNLVDIVEPDGTTSSQTVEGDWRFVDLRSADGGATWSQLQAYTYADNNKGGLIHGRPQAEHASLYNRQTNSSAVYQMMGWVGQYSINSFNDFASAIVSLAPRPKGFTNHGWQFNGARTASVNCTSDGDKQVFLGSETSILTERERQVVAASSDVQMTTRNSFAGGSRRVKFTGTDDGSGTTDTWLMGVIGANESTIAKNFSFIGGGDNVDFGVADVFDIICNGAIASQNITTGTNASFAFFGGAQSCTSLGDFTSFVGSSNCIVNSPDCDYVSFSASDSCTANDGQHISFIASDGCSIAAISGGAGGGSYSFFGASSNCSVNQSNESNVGRVGFIASVDGTSTASRTFQASSNTCETNAAGASVISSANSVNNNSNSLLVASNYVDLPASSSSETESDPYSVAGGWAASGSASTANRTWQLFSQSGNAYIAGTLTQSHTFADIAKMVKNGEGSEIEAGYLLTLIGDKVYKAREGEDVDGIVAATPSMIHNDTPFTWQGRYCTDDFGRTIKETKYFVRWDDLHEIKKEGKQYPSSATETTEIEEGELVTYVSLAGYDGLASDAPKVPDWAKHYAMQVPVENVDYDPTRANTKRSDRPDEWTIVGINGFIRTRVDKTVTQEAVDSAANSREKVYIKPIDGIGTLASGKTNVQVMCVEKPFNGSYGVALCYFKGSE